ncbi:uncharacterized protein LOC62_07G009448 [Vanrija pseudolonga]|uniref:Uncharacterized protein n=1 Tax=Vanrija pseudolonga TaxID=143232 RepID=A0AAF0YKX0_9TREE|nr:hypothetical protein LOC62_07G009448 [Vanrija pseudolonga]
MTMNTLDNYRARKDDVRKFIKDIHDKKPYDPTTQYPDIVAFTSNQVQYIINSHNNFKRLGPKSRTHNGGIVDYYSDRYGECYCGGTRSAAITDARTHARGRANFIAVQRLQTLHSLFQNILNAPLSMEALDAFCIEVAEGQAAFVADLEKELADYDEVVKANSEH